MKAYCNGPVFTGEKWLKGVCIWVENNKVVEIVAENNLPSDAEKIDLQGNIVGLDIVLGFKASFLQNTEGVLKLFFRYKDRESRCILNFVSKYSLHLKKFILSRIEKI